MADIKAVLFDFGGVFTVSPFGAVESLAKEKQIELDLFADIFFGPYHEDTQHPWHRLERGEISLEACREEILQLGQQHSLETDLWDLLMRMAEHNGGKVINQEIVDLLVHVKQQGYQTAIVTNNVKEFQSAWQEMIPMDQVDLVVDSCDVGVRKPSAEIYHLTLQKLGGLPPGQSVFLDDVEANVQAARAVGIQGIHVTPEPAQTVRALQDLLAG